MARQPLQRKMTRRGVLKVGIPTVATTVLVGPGCETLDRLDQSAAAEGTGVQLFGAIVVLARYQADGRQKSVAQTRAAKAYIEKALRPAYQTRREEIQRKAVKKKAVTEKNFTKKIAQSSGAAKTQVEAERTRVLAELKEESAREIAVATKSWKEEATAASGGSYDVSGVVVPQQMGVSLASVRQERALLVASADKYLPQYIAVSVPKKGLVSEAKASDSVMFWDTESRTLAKNEVYVIDKKPAVGKTARFDDVRAAYVGTGIF